MPPKFAKAIALNIQTIVQNTVVLEMLKDGKLFKRPSEEVEKLRMGINKATDSLAEWLQQPGTWEGIGQKQSDSDGEEMDGDLQSGLRDAGLGTDEDYGGGIERL